MTSKGIQPALSPDDVPTVSDIETVITPGVNATESDPDHEILEKQQQQIEEGNVQKDLEEDARALAQRDDGVVGYVKKPGEFTTEVFKIEIRNLPRYSGYKVSMYYYFM